jgi:hypothetical protein
LKRNSGYFDLFPEEDLSDTFVSPEEEFLSTSMFSNFFCYDCHTRFSFDKNEEPVSTNGLCKSCGSKNWIFEDELELDNINNERKSG